jgi:hypothetical protein
MISEFGLQTLVVLFADRIRDAHSVTCGNPAALPEGAAPVTGCDQKRSEITRGLASCPTYPAER